MGNLILWNETPSDSDWTKTEVYRADTEEGVYSKITTLDLPDFTYYDSAGTSTQFYKIRFTNDDASEVSSYSTSIQGALRYLYTDPKDVLRTAGMTISTLPDSITNNTIYDWIYDISKNIDSLTKKVFGRTETFEEIQSTKYLNVKQNILLEHKLVTGIKVYFRQGIVPVEGEYTWNEKKEGYDYQVFPSGRIKLFTFPVIQTPYNYRDLKITGTYGELIIPSKIEQLCKYLVAIRIFVHITGGSYNDVSSWSLGEYNESLGEPYTNLRAAIEMITKEIQRLKDETGISDKLINLRYA